MVKRWGLENGMMLSDDCGQFVDIEDYERLEAERDRLKAEVKEANMVVDHMRKEGNKLRSRHAALVEAAELLSSMVGAMMVRMTYCREILMATKMPSNKVLSMLDITTDKEIYDEITTKAALAEEVETCQKQR